VVRLAALRVVAAAVLLDQVSLAALVALAARQVRTDAA
jgi:hypothetical protein